MEMNPKGVCEKIFRAITLGPAFSIIYRISSPQQQTTVKHARTPPLPNTVKTKLTSPQCPKPTSSEESVIPIKFDYATTCLPTPTEKPKPLATITTLNGSTQTGGQAPLAWMSQQVETRKPSTDFVQSIVSGNGERAQNKSKPNRSIQVQTEQHQTKEETKKPTQNYNTFDEFIKRTRKRIMSHDDDDDQDLDKVVVVFGKNHHFSD